MKKVILVVAFCLVLIIPAKAQNEAGLFSMSANLSYGTEIESLGVGLRGQYFFLDKLRGSLEYKYFIDRHNLSEWEINADAHWVFGVSQKVYLYPIGGLKFARWTLDYGRANIAGVDSYKKSNNRLGLNLGFGGQISLSHNTYVQIELREELMKDYTQFVPVVGFTYEF